MLEINHITKEYKGGLKALSDVSLSIQEGEIFALLGPNGAGKTTLINTICGLVNITDGNITVDGHDVITDYRKARQLIGLVPQEIALDGFIPIGKMLEYARGFYGKPADPALVERTLRALSLWEKRKETSWNLSGGMKRRVLIARALMNEPKLLFLDEPTAGVDVNLRKDMWGLVKELQQNGTTVVLTTHYLEEAELLAERIGIIDGGEIKLVEEKHKLMKRLGQKTLSIKIAKPLKEIPGALAKHDLTLSDDHMTLSFSYKSKENPGITDLLNDLRENDIILTDVETKESSLEDIFVSLVK